MKKNHYYSHKTGKWALFSTFPAHIMLFFGTNTHREHFFLHEIPALENDGGWGGGVNEGID